MFTEINGLKTYFECFGQGKPLILLHGWGVDSQIWQPVCERLASNFKVVTLDLPGFGQSDLPPKPWGVFDYADFIKNFIDNLELKPTTLLGHSFGGRIAAAATSGNSGGFQKLILVSSAGIKSKRGFRYWSFFTLAKIGGAVLCFPLTKNLRPRFRKKLYQAVGEHDYETAGVLKETFLKVISLDLSPGLQKIEVPTLIIWGENDKITPLPNGQKIQKLIKNSQLEIIKGTGHFCFLEKPEEFCEIVRNFI